MSKLTVNEANGDFTHYATITFNDLQKSGFLSTIGAANQVKLATIPAGGGVVYAVAYEAEAFAGATDITLDVGTTTGDPDEFTQCLLQLPTLATCLFKELETPLLLVEHFQ